MKDECYACRDKQKEVIEVAIELRRALNHFYTMRMCDDGWRDQPAWDETVKLLNNIEEIVYETGYKIKGED